jgi:hypothetical protein
MAQYISLIFQSQFYVTRFHCKSSFQRFPVSLPLHALRQLNQWRKISLHCKGIDTTSKFADRRIGAARTAELTNFRQRSFELAARKFDRQLLVITSIASKRILNYGEVLPS